MTAHEHFLLTIERERDGGVRAFTMVVTPPHGPAVAVHCNGTHAAVIASAMHEILQRGPKVGDKWTRPEPIELDARAGAQAALLLSAIKPLRRVDRIDHVASGVSAMTREEAAYWYAKSHSPRGLRALRVLLAGEGHRL